MLDKATLNLWRQWARRDDWHKLFVGSDIRQMIGEIDRQSEIIENAKRLVADIKAEM